MAVTKIKNGAVVTTTPASNPNAELAEMVRKLQAENEALRSKAAKKGAERAGLKVSEKGCISQYGVGRYPVTLRGLTKEGVWEGSQWCTSMMCTAGLTLEQTKQTPLYAFLQENLATIKANTARHNAAVAAAGGADSEAL